MDLAQLAQTLLDKHTRRTEHLSNVLRGTARTHYKAGVEDCLRLMQEAAVREEAQANFSLPPAPECAPITGPLAVQPSHTATE